MDIFTGFKTCDFDEAVKSGMIEILGKAYVSTELGDALVFAVLIVVLLVKPTGLLGKKIHEKV